jgi:hypothetical protein
MSVAQSQIEEGKRGCSVRERGRYDKQVNHVDTFDDTLSLFLLSESKVAFMYVYIVKRK